ncbi:MAG: ribonuclease HII, partial [Candidatus Thorarchaeota archaeon]
LVGADSLVPAVSAASIIAKVSRDEYMMALDELFPEWEFYKNKGYPTPEHTQTLKENGPTMVHRMNVSIVQSAFDKKGMYDESTGEDQARTTCG